MKPKHLKALLFLFLVEGILSMALFIQKPSKPDRAVLFNFSLSRLGLVFVVFVALVGASYFLVRLYSKGSFPDRMANSIHAYLTASDDRIHLASLFLAAASLFSFEVFLIGYISLPIHIRPLLLWLVLTLLQVWLVLRFVYQASFRLKPTLWTRLRTGFTSLTRTQRQVIIAIFVLSSLYFIAFIPANFGGAETMHNFFLSGGDEYVIYPSVIKLMTPGAKISSSIHHLLIDVSWWYGYPYLPISAATLILPRIIYGLSFGDQVQINLLLLRQFISVLPMLISIALMVYLVTRFKSRLLSIGMFIFLVLIPGVVKFNYRFWHPDSLILLLTLLTVHFLVKDNLRFKWNFHLAAVTCALSAVLKLWGFFFFLVIAGYLLAGLIKKILTVKRTFLAGTTFIVVMAGTMLISTPAYLYPPAVDALINDWGNQLSTNAVGYDEPDPDGVYQTGMENWLKYFDKSFMRPWFFFFSFTALLLGSLWGSQTYLNRILLGWCLVTAIYLIYFVSVKSFQYMIPLMLPLYMAGFLLPALAEVKTGAVWSSKLPQPFMKLFLWGITILLYSIQFIINITKILDLPFINV
ncbi:hypothetical protein ACFLXB_00635 [Chloroflexota bacterium]